MENKKTKVTKKDEKDGKVTYDVNGNIFTVETRYELIDMIGSGAYGIVVAAKDHGDLNDEGKPKLVAIKKIVKAFEHRIFALRTLREIKI